MKKLILIALLITPLSTGCLVSRNLNKLLGLEKKTQAAEAGVAKNQASQAAARDSQLEVVRENNSAIRKSLESPNLDESSPYWAWCHIAYSLAEANESALGAPKSPLDTSALFQKFGMDRQKAESALSTQVSKTQAATAKYDVEVAKGKALQDKLDAAEKKQHETESALATAQAKIKDLWLSVKITFFVGIFVCLAYMAFRIYLTLNPATAGVSLGLTAARAGFKELVGSIEKIKETVFSHPAIRAVPDIKESLEMQVKNILLDASSSSTSAAADRLTKSKLD